MAASVVCQRVNILRGEALLELLGPGSFDAVDILGFFEYVPDRTVRAGRATASEFLAAAWALVAPGGLLVLGNMLDDYPEFLLLHVMQWPLIIPRSISDLATLIEGAELSGAVATLLVPVDGVFAIVTLERPTLAPGADGDEPDR